MKQIKEFKNKLLLTAFYILCLLIFWWLELPCFYRWLFGVVCPGCGMSRAYFSLLKLDFIAAFNYHPMFWSVPIAYLYFLFDGKLLGKKYLDYGILGLIAVGFLINWIANVC